jgi:hypothetical protein
MLILKQGFYNINKLMDNETTVNVSSFINTDPVFRIIIPSIGFIGLITNIACVIIFSNKDFKEDMYHYLKFKSIAVIMHLFIQILRPLSILKGNFSSASIISVIYDLYFLSYFVSFFELSIILFHILSTIEYYLIVSNNNDVMKLIRKVSCRSKILFIFIFSMFMYIDILFSRVIHGWHLAEINESNKIVDQRIYYSIQTTSFGSTMARKIISSIVFMIRDGLNLVILVILNILIYLNVMESIKKKRAIIFKSRKVDDSTKSVSIGMSNSGSSKSTSSNNNKKINKTERKVTLMVLFSSITYVSTRIPLLICVILGDYANLNLWGTTFGRFTTIYLYVTYLIDILYFYIFNERFKKIFDEYLFKIFKINIQ